MEGAMDLNLSHNNSARSDEDNDDSTDRDSTVSGSESSARSTDSGGRRRISRYGSDNLASSDSRSFNSAESKQSKTGGKEEMSEFALIDAVKYEELDSCEELLDDDECVYATEPSGKTALHYAAQIGNVEILRLLLDNTSLLRKKDNDGWSALFYAVLAETNEPELIDLLMSEGLWVEKDREKKTPLYYAADLGKLDVMKHLMLSDNSGVLVATKLGDKPIVDTLLSAGADPTGDHPDDLTPLHIAAAKGDISILRLLKSYNAPYTADIDNWTALHFATANGQKEAVQFILDEYTPDMEKRTKKLKQQSSNHKRRTALHLAAENGHLEIVKLLVENGADLTAKTNSKNLAVHLACYKENDDVALFVCEAGDIESFFVENKQRETGFRLAARYGCTRTVEKLAGEVKNRILDNERSNMSNRCSSIFEALKNGHEETAMVLLNIGLPVEGIDESRNNALHFAAKHGFLDVVRSLLVYRTGGAGVNEPNCDTKTPIDLAAEGGYDEIVAVLLQVNLPPNRNPPNDTAGWTGLHWAVYHERLDIIGKLVTKGGNVRATDHQRDTPYELAKKQWVSNPRSYTFLVMKEWLEPRQETPTEPTRHLTKPVNPTGQMKAVCEYLSVYMIGAYNHEGTLYFTEKPEFSISHTVYEYGPKMIISVASQRIGNTQEEKSAMFTWIHLPANNKVWVKDLIRRIYVDQGRNEEAKTDHFYLNNFIDEAGIEHSGPLQSRFIEPFFKHLRTYTRSSNGLKGYRLAVSMPYFSFLKVKEQKKLQGIVDRAEPQTRQTTPTNGGDNNNRNNVAVNTDNWEEQMILSYKEELHVSRTLDRFYYHSLPNTTSRDRSQVLYRNSRVDGAPDDSDSLVCMVDQLWLFVVDDYTVITSFPKKSLQDLISNHFIDDKDRRPQISSAYEMVALILSICIKETTSRTIPDRTERLLPVFAASIGKAANDEVQLFEDFEQSIKCRDYSETGNPGKEKTQDISKEMEVLREIKDIQDELNIIRIVLEKQDKVSNEAFDLIDVPDSERALDRDEDDYSREKLSRAKVVDYYRKRTELDLRIREIHTMIDDANKVYKNVNHLLDLKQKDADLSEAVWARKSSEDTARQGKTILVFTIVTIIFLPMSFLSSLFALNITSFPHASGELQYTPAWAFTRIIGITFGISVPLIVLAVFVNDAWGFLATLFNLGSDREKTKRQGQPVPQPQNNHGNNESRVQNRGGFLTRYRFRAKRKREANAAEP